MMASISSDNRGLRLVVRYAVLTLIAAIFSFPLIFMVMSSLKTSAQLLNDAHSIRALLPVGDISLDNYFAAFQRVPGRLHGRVALTERLGSETVIEVLLTDGSNLIVALARDATFAIGTEISLAFDPAMAHLFAV